MGSKVDSPIKSQSILPAKNEKKPKKDFFGFSNIGKLTKCVSNYFKP
jgi:hypothetical protein